MLVIPDLKVVETSFRTGLLSKDLFTCITSIIFLLFERDAGIDKRTLHNFAYGWIREDNSSPFGEGHLCFNRHNGSYNRFGAIIPDDMNP